MSSSDHKLGFYASLARAKHRWSTLTQHDSHFAPSVTSLFMGISCTVTDEATTVSLAFHDHTYLVDYTIERLPRSRPDGKDAVVEFVIDAGSEYERQNNVKFVGAAMPRWLVEERGLALCSRLWLDLDVIPLVVPQSEEKAQSWAVKNIDEQADSMARKCGEFFGPSLTPLLQVGFRGVVLGDSDSKASMVTLEDYRALCSEATWATMMRYATALQKHGTRIAFFSATPQGGGVALMRHALRRFSHLLGVNLSWYVPKPRPGVFRSTKDMHNILQGVNKPDNRLTKDKQDAITDWIAHNAHTYWLSPGGPLRPVEEGGAHVIVVDDPQMPTLIPLIKQLTPNRPVIFRSHIQIRSDLIAEKGSPQEEAWGFLWKAIRLSDLFISHPIPEFVPRDIPKKMVAYMPATTDWLDGLNKPIGQWARSYYFNLYNRECMSHQMTKLAYPERKYIVQIARFDPAKGIPTVLKAYASFRKRASKADITNDGHATPHHARAGNSSIDDPDAGIVFDEALTQIETTCPDLLDDISIMRLQAHDQLLNTLLSNAHVVLQLSTREGFEVKVSEALHAGRPVIATRAGGIPIQVKDGEDAFLVDIDDHEAVAERLLELCEDPALWARMSRAAATGVSDEVGTVGNALCWYYLAAKLGIEKEEVAGDCRWINDLARVDAGYPYEASENRLPRSFTEEKEGGEGVDMG
ncbi:glycosyltransferase family 4 protein [Xylaria sp. FL1042]|nr:glycosyltransferase family 4 protein [Xylaria sp. FL1042]